MRSAPAYCTITPCSGNISDNYADDIRYYQGIVGELREQLHQVGEVYSSQLQYVDDTNEEIQNLNKETRELKNKLEYLKRINANLNQQVNSYQIQSSQRATIGTQIDDIELIQLKQDNELLKKQVQQLIEMTHHAIDTQQMLVNKYHNKKVKLQNLRLDCEDFSINIQKSKDKQRDLNQHIQYLAEVEALYKAENMRANLRLAETEGNLQESELMNEKLRQKYHELASRQHQQIDEAAQTIFVDRFVT